MTQSHGFRRVTIAMTIALTVLAAGCGQAQPSNSAPAPATGGQTSVPTGSQLQLDDDVKKAHDSIAAEIPGVGPELVQAAKKEGKVVFYHLSNPGTKGLIDAFKQTFPFIQVEEFEATGGPTSEKFQSENRAGKYIADVLMSSTLGGMDQWAADGMLMNYKIANDSAYPDEVKKSGVRYPTSYTTIAIGYNANKVSEEDVKVLSTWEGLLDPRFAKRPVGIVDVAGGGINHTAQYAMWKTHGEKIWQAVSKMNFKIYGGAPVMADAMAAGEIDLGLWSSDTGLYQAYLKGAPIRWVYPTPVPVGAYGQIISAKAPHPNAAKLFQEFTFTKTGQTAWAKVSSPSFRKDVGDLRTVNKESWYKQPTQFFKLDETQLSKDLSQLLKLWNGYFRS